MSINHKLFQIVTDLIQEKKNKDLTYAVKFELLLQWTRGRCFAQEVFCIALIFDCVCVQHPRCVQHDRGSN